MPVSGLVVTLSQPTAELLARLGQHPALTCGELAGNRLPVVMETKDDRASRDVHAWIESLPEVLMADVVYVAFDDCEASLSELA